MWALIMGVIFVGWVILRIEKNFNSSIQILEDRISQQQHQINNLYSEIQDLKIK